MTTTRPRLAWPALLLAALAAAVAACGGGGVGDAQRAANDAERAFLQGMVPHHESAVEMARLASREGEHAEVRELAGRIEEAQAREIETMRSIHERLFDGASLEPDPRAHERLGLGADEAGMGHEDLSGLRRADPFDRAFVDMMVPHHRGAIRMAHVVLEQTDDAELSGLARAIVAHQSREVEQMNAWREAWYGAESPAGGVPRPGEHGGRGGGEHGAGHGG
jgi:uncharacterized protein (DUF305 family)